MKTLRITVIYGKRMTSSDGSAYFLPRDVSRKIYDVLTSGIDRAEAHRSLDLMLDEIEKEEKARATRVRFT